MNIASSSKPVRQTNRLVRFFVVFGILAGVAVFILVIFFSVWRWQLRESINSQIAAIKTTGLPSNWEDLAKWPVEIPDGENTALIYTNAIAELRAKTIPELRIFPHAVKSSLLKIVRDWNPSLAQILKAMQIAYTITNASQARYPINYLDGPVAQLPHLDGLKSLAILLQCDAILKADALDSTGASRAAESSLKLSESLNNEPFLISQLTSAAILAISSQTLEQILCRTKLSNEQLLRLGEEFSQCETNNRFYTGMAGERALNNEFIRLAQDDVRKMVEISNHASSPEDQTDMPYRNPGFGWRLIGFWERDRNFFLQGMATNLFFIQQGPPNSLLVSNVNSRIETRAKNGFYICSSMFLPSLSGAVVRDASTRARLRNSLVALSVERWRLAHENALPKSLNDLVPDFLPSVPKDPFDGKPLRYKKTEGGYLIYSVGPNQQDDGGREIPPPSVKISREQRANYDIVFTVER